MTNDPNKPRRSQRANRSGDGTPSSASSSPKPPPPAASTPPLNTSSTSLTRRRLSERRAANRAADEPAEPISAAPANVPIAGRGRAAERMKERQQEKQRQRFTIYGVVAAVFIGLIVLAVLVVNAPADAPIPAESAARYEDVVQSRNEEGYPRLGEPRVPLQVSLYSGFDCLTCGTFYRDALDPLVQRVRDGVISLTFVPLTGSNEVTNGRGAAEAALCAVEQNNFWRLHDAMFNWQSAFGNQAYTNNRIQSGVGNLGLDRGAFNGCVTSDRMNEVLSRAQTQARGLTNFTVTPAIAVNGIILVDDENQPLTDAAAVIAVIDERIAQVAAQQAAREATAEPELEPTAESDSTAEATPESTATLEAVSTAEPTAESTTEATPE